MPAYGVDARQQKKCYSPALNVVDLENTNSARCLLYNRSLKMNVVEKPAVGNEGQKAAAEMVSNCVHFQ